MTTYTIDPRRLEEMKAATIYSGDHAPPNGKLEGCAMESIDGRATSVAADVRFWSHVLKGAAGECWAWRGRLNYSGYGITGIGGRRNARAHRVAYELARGEIPPGLVVCHRCDNPKCCNPAHLFLGTQADNNRDRHAKGRSKNLDRGELHPKAKLSGAQVNEMRRLRGEGWTQQKLADRFGVSRGNVSKIVNGRSY